MAIIPILSGRRSRKGFTLIELLVVIAIIAILAAILFPVFAQARQQAKNIAEMSNMKQLGTAMIMYQGDHADMFPLTFGEDANQPFPFQIVGGRRIITFHHMILPYAKPQWSMLVCPEYIPTNQPNPLRIDPFISYGMPPRAQVHGIQNWTDTYYLGFANRWNGIGGGFPDNPWTPGIRGASSATMSDVAEPSRQGMLVESTAPDWWLIKYGTSSAVQNSTFNYFTNWAAYGNQTSQTFGPYFRHDMRVRRAAPQRYISLCSGSGATRRCDAGWAYTIMTDSHAKRLDFLQFLGSDSRGTFRTFRYLAVQ